MAAGLARRLVRLDEPDLIRPSQIQNDFLCRSRKLELTTWSAVAKFPHGPSYSIPHQVRALRSANAEGCGERRRATAAALPPVRRDRSADHADGYRLAAGRAEATKVTKSGEGELLTSRRAIHIQPLAGLARRRHRGGQALQATP
jgi:hypothetical protein